jgi:hypothetical protein
MKKFLPVLALLGILVACNSKKKDETKAEDTSATIAPTTTTTPTTPSTTTTTTTPNKPPSEASALVPSSNANASANTGDAPQYTDPAIQKFVKDYIAFVNAYKKGIVDPSKAKAFADERVKWTAKFGINAQKLSTNPEELRKFRALGEAMNREMAEMPK